MGDLAKQPFSQLTTRLLRRIIRRDKMMGMAKLSYEFKLPGRSLPEVYERFVGALVRHQGARRVRGRTPVPRAGD